jgi:hypothetical protein
MPVTPPSNEAQTLSEWARLVARHSLRMVDQVAQAWSQKPRTGRDAFDPFAGFGSFGRERRAPTPSDSPSKAPVKRSGKDPLAGLVAKQPPSPFAAAEPKAKGSKKVRGQPPSPFEALDAPIRPPKRPQQPPAIRRQRPLGPAGAYSEQEERALRAEPRLSDSPEPLEAFADLALAAATLRRLDAEWLADGFANDPIWRASAQREAQLQERVRTLFDFDALRPRSDEPAADEFSPRDWGGWAPQAMPAAPAQKAQDGAETRSEEWSLGGREAWPGLEPGAAARKAEPPLSDDESEELEGAELPQQPQPKVEAPLAREQADGQWAFAFSLDEGERGAAIGEETAPQEPQGGETHGELADEDDEATADSGASQASLNFEQAIAGWMQEDGQGAFHFMWPEGAQAESDPIAADEAEERDDGELAADELLGGLLAAAASAGAQAELDFEQTIPGWAQADGQIAFHFMWPEGVARRETADASQEAPQEAAVEAADAQAELDFEQAIPGWAQGDGQFAFHFMLADDARERESLARWEREAQEQQQERLAQASRAAAFAEARAQEQGALALAAQAELDFERAIPGWEQEDGQFAFHFTLAVAAAEIEALEECVWRARQAEEASQMARAKSLHAQKRGERARQEWIEAIGWEQLGLDWSHWPAQELAAEAQTAWGVEALAMASVLGALAQAAPTDEQIAQSARDAAAERAAAEREEEQERARLAQAQAAANEPEPSAPERIAAPSAPRGVPPAEVPAERARATKKDEGQKPGKARRWREEPFRPFAEESALQALETSWSAEAIVEPSLAEEFLGRGSLLEEAQSEADWATGGDPALIASWKEPAAPLELREHPAFRGIGMERAPEPAEPARQEAPLAPVARSGAPKDAAKGKRERDFFSDELGIGKARAERSASEALGQKKWAPAWRSSGDNERDPTRGAPRDEEASAFLESVMDEPTGMGRKDPTRAGDEELAAPLPDVFAQALAAAFAKAPTVKRADRDEPPTQEHVEPAAAEAAPGGAPEPLEAAEEASTENQESPAEESAQNETAEAKKAVPPWPFAAEPLALAAAEPEKARAASEACEEASPDGKPTLPREAAGAEPLGAQKLAVGEAEAAAETEAPQSEQEDPDALDEALAEEGEASAVADAQAHDWMIADQFLSAIDGAGAPAKADGDAQEPLAEDKLDAEPLRAEPAASPTVSAAPAAPQAEEAAKPAEPARKKSAESLFGSLIAQAKSALGVDGKKDAKKERKTGEPDEPQGKRAWGARVAGDSRRLDASAKAEPAEPPTHSARAELFLARLLARNPRTSLRWIAPNGAPAAPKIRGARQSAAADAGSSVGKIWALTAPLPIQGDAQWEEERRAGHAAVIESLRRFWGEAAKEEKELLGRIVCCAQSVHGALTAATFEEAVLASAPLPRARAARNELQQLMAQGDPDF